MGEVVYKSSSGSPGHPIAQVAYVASIVHHSGHIQVEVVLAGGELAEEGSRSASSAAANRGVVEIGEWGLLHLVRVMPPEGKAPHPITRHSSTPNEKGFQTFTIHDSVTVTHLSRAAKSCESVQKTPVAAVPNATEQAPVRVAMSSTLEEYQFK